MPRQIIQTRMSGRNRSKQRYQSNAWYLHAKVLCQSVLAHKKSFPRKWRQSLRAAEGPERNNDVPEIYRHCCKKSSRSSEEDGFGGCDCCFSAEREASNPWFFLALARFLLLAFSEDFFSPCAFVETRCAVVVGDAEDGACDIDDGLLSSL